MSLPGGQSPPATLLVPRATDHTSLHILLLDELRLFTEALRRQLLEQSDIAGVALATSGPAALRLCSERPIGVVVAAAALVPSLWESSGPRGYPPPKVPVIALADHGELDRAAELVRLGVVGWVDRSRSTADLIAAIRTCRRGDVWMPATTLAAIVAESRPDTAPDTGRNHVLRLLSEREMQVFTLLEQGLSRPEIAEQLHLSPNTVRTHVQRILRRLNTHSTLAALALARDGDGSRLP